MESFNLRLFIYLLPIPVLVFYSMFIATTLIKSLTNGIIGLALKGCTSNSPALPSIYTLKIQSKTDSSQTQRSQRFVWATLVRQPSSSRGFTNTINLLGLCVSSLAGMDCGLMTGMTAGGLVQRYNLLRNGTTTTITTSTSIELEQLFPLGLSLQRIIPPLLSVGCALFFIGILSLAGPKRRLWRSQLQETRKMRLLPTEYTLAIIWESAAFGLVSAASVDLTATRLQFITSTLANSSISIRAGIALVVLHSYVQLFSNICFRHI